MNSEKRRCKLCNSKLRIGNLATHCSPCQERIAHSRIPGSPLRFLAVFRRCSNTLHRLSDAGIETLGELTACSREQLVAFGFGKSTIEEIEDVLATFDLGLRVKKEKGERGE